MSLIFKIKNSDFSGAGLPKLEQTILGFPGDGLQGLYLFEDGVTDSLNAGPFNDSSGMGNHASIFSDFVTPIKRSYGLEVSDVNGLILDTGIVQGQDFTVIACLKNTIDTIVADGYPTWFGDTANGVPATRLGSSTNSPRFAPNMQLTNDGNLNGLYSEDGLMLGANGSTRRAVDEEAYGGANEAGILSLSVDGEGNAGFKTYSGFDFSVQDGDIPAAYAGLTATQVIGLWPHASYRPCTSQLYGFAIYNKALTPDQQNKAMSAMYSRVAARGIAVVS